MPTIICQIGLNKTDLVHSFEEIGWFNPDVDPQQARKTSLEWLKRINWNTNVYPAHLIDDYHPPGCIFVPTPEVMRKMILTCAKHKKLADVKAVFNAY